MTYKSKKKNIDRMSKENLNQIDFKVEDRFCTLISNFRTLLDQLNTVFIDLVGYHQNLKENCKALAEFNNQCIRKFILSDDKSKNLLIHRNLVYLIENYLNQNKSKAPKLLKEINKEVKNLYDDFLASSKSPYKIKISQSAILNKKLDKFKKLIDETGKQTSVVDDYFDEISSIFDRSDDSDEDDDDSFSKNEKRFYKDSYPEIPKNIQESVNELMAYINSQILIRNILNYDNEINRCYEKLGITRPVLPDDDATSVDYEIYIQVVNENEALKQQIKEYQQQIKKLNSDASGIGKKKDKEIKDLEKKLIESDKTIRDLKSEIKQLKLQSQKKSNVSAPKINLKDDDRYLNAVSYFRKSIDNMNTSFMDLIQYDRDLLNNFKEIYNINNQFIHDLVVDNSSDLTHYSRLFNIYQYYIKESGDKNICTLLFNLKSKIERKLNKFQPFVFAQKIYPQLCQSIEKRLKIEKDSIERMRSDKSYDIITDFISDNIERFVQKDNKSDDSDDEDEDDRNDKRYYGDPFSIIPPIVQKRTNQSIAYMNVLISINSILEFNQYVDWQLNKAPESEIKNSIIKRNEYFVKFKEISYGIKLK